MKPKFLIDQHMMDIGNPELADIVRGLGFEVTVARANRLIGSIDTPCIEDSDCVVIYGSHQFIKQAGTGRHFHPGAYYSDTAFRCSHYYPRIPKDWLANQRYLLLPFGEVMRSIDSIYELFQTNSLFIRPDSGAKVFAGQVIEQHTSGFGLDTINRLSGAVSETLCLVAPFQPISVEYRFFIVGGQVVAGSRYMVNGEPSVSPDIDPACRHLAEGLANQEWQIDRAYSCDVGLIHGQPKVVELNSFSAAGLYACDAKALFSAVAAEAILDFNQCFSD